MSETMRNLRDALALLQGLRDDKDKVLSSGDLDGVEEIKAYTEGKRDGLAAVIMEIKDALGEL